MRHVVALAVVTALLGGSAQAAHFAARTMGVEPGRSYTVAVRGTGSVGLYGAAQAVARPDRATTFMARSRVLALVPRGAVSGVTVTQATGRARCGRRPTVGSGRASADVAVVGAHAAGLAAAIAAARACLSVVLVSAEPHPGGMLTAGQIGWTDGMPEASWLLDNGLGDPVNGTPYRSAWSVMSSLWREFRTRVSLAKGDRPASMVSSLHYEPRTGVAAVEAWLRELPNLRVLRNTVPVAAAMSGAAVDHVDLAGGFDGRLTASFWVDGSDSGSLVGLLHLPYSLGPDSDPNDVMSYAYRWTAVEADAPGEYPASPPLYYALNRPDYDADVASDWPDYAHQFGIRDGSTYAVHPFALFNRNGLLAGPPGAIAEPGSGAAPPGPPQKWDVNAEANDASTWAVAKMLARNDAATSIFARNHLGNPYTGTSKDLKWAGIAFVEDEPQLPAGDRAQLVRLIEQAVKARAYGLLWYIRSGDMLARLRRLPGGGSVGLRATWSISNELGTVDGFPELIYQREGRRIVAERTETVYDLCPSFDGDVKAPQRTCTTQPRTLQDAVALSDFAVDTKLTGTVPGIFFRVAAPHQLSFGSLIPRGTRGLLVGGGIGADRYAYGSFRVDPVRFGIGEAIGTAIALAAHRKDSAFQDLPVAALRWRLAENGTPTSFVPSAPVWNEQQRAWTLDGVATGIQELIVAGMLDGGVLDPSLPLTGRNGAELRARAGGRPVPWLADGSGAVTALRRLTGTRVAGQATVGDAYVWLASGLRAPGGAS